MLTKNVRYSEVHYADPHSISKEFACLTMIQMKKKENYEKSFGFLRECKVLRGCIEQYYSAQLSCRIVIITSFRGEEGSEKKTI